MAQSATELISRQETIFNNLKQICINYKKDSPTRKSLDYLEERHSRLKINWEQFVRNHQLLEESGTTDHQYFTDDVYNTTKRMYEDVRQDILKRKAGLPASSTSQVEAGESPMASTAQGKARFSFDDIKFHVPPRDTSETNDKQQELLRQQYCNFRAFERAVDKINFTLTITKEKWELEDDLNILKTKWEYIEKANWQLDYILQDEDSVYKQKYDAAEDIYDDMRKKLQHKIWNNAHYEKSTPKIEIPDFNGKYSQWLTFRDLYVESVHNNPVLSKAQKMQHLKTKLKGDAEKLVQHLGISAENYTSCWEILAHRYDNKRLLFTSYMNTLLNQPTIQQASAASIRKLHDVMLECLNGLRNIGLDISNWDPIVVHLLVQKLDSVTYNEYIKDIENPRGFPDLKEFTEFLESKFMALEVFQGNNQKSSTANKTGKSDKQTNYASEVERNTSRGSSYFKKSKYSPKVLCTTARNCPICKTDHVLMKCDKFLAMNARTRGETVRNMHICPNCLYDHEEKQCNSRKTCRVCRKAHHTLLHEADLGQPSNQPSQRASSSSASNSYAVNNILDDEKEVLLTTVLLKVKSIDGEYLNLRGLLDQGSQVSLITESAAQRLRLPRRKMSAVISGVGALGGNCKGAINLECKSIHTDYRFNIETLIMNKLISNLPTASFSINNWTYLENLKLADPHFNTSGPIDLLLGADIYAELILDGVMKSQNSCYPVAQQTKVGWVLCGKVKTFNCFVTLNELENITRFWETEDITSTTDMSTSTTEEQYCEDYYNSTTTRLTNGQYVVEMPMKPNYESNINSNKSQALAQFLQLERKMQANKELRREYNKFMEEYITMGHMKPVLSQEGNKIYLPHHGVIRAESTTTKLRVVFNASYKLKDTASLNDLMYCGPNLQKDMFTLLIYWRTCRYVFTADVEKLYRFIWLNEKQQNLQTVLWRPSGDLQKEPIREWNLKTITYGMKCAPYLAMRTLHQLAKDEGESYPEASKILQNFFYMDDLVYGQDTIEASKELVGQLIELLKKGGFNLRKWKSNEPTILQDLREDQKSTNTSIDFNPEQISNTKMLGMRWNQRSDNFSYQWKLPEQKRLTKRILLSEISKLYDPLGFLSPFIIKTKLLFQKVWTTTAHWDECLPNEITAEWETIRKGLPLINGLAIPRWLQCQDTNVEVHGFCDASEKAYACVIYSRVMNQHGNYVITLITAKTKVAPINKKISLPRMELSSALLLAKLIEKVKLTLIHKQLQINCWSDSKVVLAWLQGDINRWERYVANRVAQINNIISAEHWQYVRSKDNSADCATRGLSASQLLNFKLWWEGPELLKTYSCSNKHEKTMTYSTNDGQRRKKCCVATYKNDEVIKILLNKFSSYKRVIRVLGWILRFINNLKNTTNSKNNLPDCDETKMVMCLTSNEILKTTKLVVINVQEEYFGEEIDCLKRNKPVPKRSKLLNLTPFLDENGLLRVQGRLTNSTLPFQSKHPIIIPATGRLTELIIQEAHLDTLHGGARLTLAQLRLKFWVIGGSRTVKKQLLRCVRCHRFKTTCNNQQMAALPKERVTPGARAFTATGVDFTGHVDVKINKGRGVKTCKAYIAIFICMVTKAVHLELVSDLTTQTFLAAFKRMCARRGTPKQMFSDNGTNFVGAARLLQEDFERYKTFETSEFYDEMNNLQVQWNFNAPLWPTAGGLWEAAVKSMKYHLHRVLGEQKLTFEQFTTLLAQIEACLNSRPLCPLTEDVDDLEYLTPGHFLIGGPLLSLPQEEEDFAQHDLRNRWRLIEQMNLHIWKRWSNEYLHQLQVRSKWHHPKENLKEGSLVLIKDDFLPPGRWALGRVKELHPGTDGMVRVVTLKTKKGQLKRPITKLSPLPIESVVEETEDNTEKEKQLTSETKTRRSTTKSNFLSLILLSILSITEMAQSASTTNNMMMTLIPDDHPIYFDEAGKVKLMHDEWSLLIYYNLSSYWQATEKITDYINQIDSLCQRVSHEYEPCEIVVNQLRHKFRHLAEYNSILLSQHIRQKRGYFDGVGKLARTLFGVLDADFAEKYEDDIKNLQTNDNYLLQLIKNQTLIIEAENNVIKRNAAFIDKQFETIQTYMNRTSNVITKIENRAHILYVVNDINSAAVTSTLILDDLQRILDLLMNTLSNIYNGHLDTHLFSATQLIDQLRIIAGKLPAGLSLPVKDIEKEFRNIYDLIHVKARITNNYFLFELHIPLLSDEVYRMYKVIPIPFRREGRLKLVLPSSTFIAINFAKNSYITMEEQDMRQCTAYGDDEYICVSQKPIYSLQDKDAPCEAKVFSQQPSLSCVLSDTACKENWAKLHKPNLWLFTLCDKQLIRILCKDRVTPTVIDGTGVITLEPKCLLQKRDATIFAYNQRGSNFYMEPDIEIPTINSTINSMFDLGWKHAQLNITDLGTTTIPDAIKVQQAIDYQKNQEVLPPMTSSISSHDIYLYSVTSMLLGGIATYLLYLFAKRWLDRKGMARKRNRNTDLQGRGNAGLECIEMQEMQQPTRTQPATSTNEVRKPFQLDGLETF